MAESGDFDPMDTLRFTGACKRAVQQWAMLNVPGFHEHTEADDEVPPGFPGAHTLGAHAHEYEEGDNHTHLTHARSDPRAHDPVTLYDDRVNRDPSLAPGWTCADCEPGGRS